MTYYHCLLTMKMKQKNVDNFKVYLNLTEYPSSEGYDSISFQNISKDLSNASAACKFNVVKMDPVGGKVMS